MSARPDGGDSSDDSDFMGRRTGGPGGSGPPVLSELLESALAFAREAGEVTLRYFGGAVPAEAKADGSPVTWADREAETVLRDLIAERYPDHSVLGEEFGVSSGTSAVRWILDPIDGTRSFMRGVPLYAVLIGVEVDGEPAVGVVHMPALGESVAAAKGLGCTWWQSGSAEGAPARVSDTATIAAAAILTTDLERVLASDIGSGWRDLSGRVDIVRGWGDAYGHALVATGRADVMVDPILSTWDAAPLLPIVREAGGRFTDLSGEATILGDSGISTNGRLHDEVLRALRGE